MLISQQIVKSNKFLTVSPSGKASPRSPVTIETKQKVMMARKVIIDDHFVPYEITHYRDPIIGGIRPVLTLQSSYMEGTVKKHCELYTTYAKMPVDLMVIESNRHCLLLEKIDDKSFTILNLNMSAFDVTTLVNDFAFISIVKTKITNSSVLEIEPLLYNSEARDYLARKYSAEQMKEVGEQMIQTSNFSVFLALEVLLYMNTVNKEVKIYKPTKNELKFISKPLHSKFEYWILDIFRNKKMPEKLSDLPGETNDDNAVRTQYRSHLVRGHHKKVKGKLYWWNSFTRCRKNAETVGVIEKDYRLNDKAIN